MAGSLLSSSMGVGSYGRRWRGEGVCLKQRVKPKYYYKNDCVGYMNNFTLSFKLSNKPTGHAS